MRTFRTMLAAALLLALAAALLPGDAQAIPAFARTHKLSCTTCHAPFPRLKEFGNEFAANGFTIPEQEKDRDFISAGDDLLKLNRTFPLAVRFDAFAVYESDAAIDNDLQIPYGLKLLSGGNVASNVGYYFYFYMNERGEVAEDGVVAGLEEPRGALGGGAFEGGGVIFATAVDQVVGLVDDHK